MGSLAGGDHELWITIPYSSLNGKAVHRWFGWRRRDLIRQLRFGRRNFCHYITLRAHRGRRSGNYLYCATHLGLESGLDMGYGYKEL